MFAADAILELGRLAESPEADRVGGDFDLGLGALLIAAAEYPDIDIESSVANLDRMAEAAGGRLAADSTSLQQLNTITDRCSASSDFRETPRITTTPAIRTSMTCCSGDWAFPSRCRSSASRLAAGWCAAAGDCMPGHFLINHRAEPNFFVDTFNGGLLLNQDECGALLRQSAGDQVTLEAHHLNPITPREMLARLLRNLKAIYWDREDFDRCISTIGGLMAVLPDRPENGATVAWYT